MRTASLIRRSILATAAGAVALSLLGSSASALTDDGGLDTDTAPSAAPDLRVSAATVSMASSTQWKISYTVRNDGHGASKASQVAFRNNDSSVLLSQRPVPALAPGAERSEAILVSRSSCYLPLRAEADSTRTAGDLLTGNNTRWAIGQTLPCSSLPRYRVKAISFRAADESNYDGAGSDEPYWIFNTVSNSGTAGSQASTVFGDVDSGESRTFAANDGCIYGACTGSTQAPHGLGFSVQLWEKDLGHVDQTLFDTAEAFQDAGPIITMAGGQAWVGKTVEVMGHAMEAALGWADDDLIGNTTYALTPEYLISRISRAGGSFTDTRAFEGASTSGGANYTLTLQITRVS
jgi:hypothetical protein